MGLGWVGIFVWAELYVSRARLIPLEEVHEPFSRIRKHRLTAELLALACVRSFPGCPCLCYLGTDAEEREMGRGVELDSAREATGKECVAAPTKMRYGLHQRSTAAEDPNGLLKETKADTWKLKFLSQVISSLRKDVTLELSVD